MRAFKIKFNSWSGGRNPVKLQRGKVGVDDGLPLNHDGEHFVFAGSYAEIEARFEDLHNIEQLGPGTILPEADEK